MKIRTGFVSNSSSSSFIVPLSSLTYEQINQIRNHLEFGKDFGIEDFYGEYDGWSIYEDEGFLKGDTFIDNFDMRAFLEAIGVNDVQWNQ